MSRIDDLIKEFSRYYFQDRRASIGTCTKYEESLHYFFRKIKKPIDEITYADINYYISQLQIQGLAINTQRSRQVAIRKFYEWYTKFINPNMENPGDKVQLIHEEIKIPEILSPDEVMRMIYIQDQSKFIGLRDAALICLLADTGIRKSELALLKMGNIEMRDDNYLLKVPRIKSYERNVPFGKLKENSFVGEYFTAYWSHRTIVNMARKNDPLFITDGPIHKGNALSISAIELVVKRAARRAKVDKRVTPHSFRHFYGTYLYINGTDIMQIKELMGHALLETTQRYIHIASSITGKFLDTGATSGFDRAPAQSSGFIRIYKQSRTKR